MIRLVYMIKRPRPRVRLTRREIFMRDHHACQYCGIRTRDLTLDHVVPRHRGGRHTWDNLVSACRSCNHRKGGRTPEEARMPLRRSPSEPRATSYYLFHQYLESERFQGWTKFMPEWERERVELVRVGAGRPRSALALRRRTAPQAAARGRCG